MRVGIDARVLCAPKCGGANYLCQLIFHTPRLDPRLELVLFSPKPILDEYAPFLNHERVSQVVAAEPKAGKPFGAARYWRPLLIQHKIDVFHQPFNADGPYFPVPCSSVVTILDLIPWIVPGNFRNVFKKFRYISRNVIWAWVANRITTISDASRKDIVRLCRVPSGKVAVTYLGADDIYHEPVSAAEAQAVLAKFGLTGKKYFLNMSGLNNIRRNPQFMIQGFGRYLRDNPKDNAYLVFTGSILKQDGFYDRVQTWIDEAGIRERVIVTGFLSDRELKVILSCARISVITSLHEGFCLPLTESYACGVPVIANDRGSIPEIAGDGAILVSPYAPEKLAVYLHELDTDEELRERLMDAGRERNKMFIWQNTARETLQVYRSLMHGGKLGHTSYENSYDVSPYDV